MERAFQFSKYIGFCKTEIEDGNGIICYSDDNLHNYKKEKENNTSNWNSFKTKISTYTNYLWSFVKSVSADHIESVIEISEECDRKEDMVYCFHNVKFIYNDTEYEKIFSSHDIVKMCKRLNYKLPSHLSQGVWCKEIGIPHSQIKAI